MKLSLSINYKLNFNVKQNSLVFKVIKLILNKLQTIVIIILKYYFGSIFISVF